MTDACDRYRVLLLTGGCTASIELAAETYEQVRSARNHLLTALAIEEKYALLMANYLEFEEELLHLTARSLLFDALSWSGFRGHTQTLDRRLANLLSACRLYVDQVKHDTKAIYRQKSRELLLVEAAFRAEYDTVLGYRAMEALRNYVQHESLPIHHLSYCASVRETPEGLLFRHICTPSVSMRILREQNCDIKSQVMVDLEAAAKNGLVDLKPLVRDYISSLGRVHTGIRQRMKPDIEQWDQTVSLVRARFLEVSDTDGPDLAAVCQDASGALREVVYLSDDVSSRRREQEATHPARTDLRRQYVSSEVAGDQP